MKTVLIIIAFPVIVFLSVRFIEQKSLYHPLKDIRVTPEDAGMDFEDIALTGGDGVRITGWFVPSEASRAVLLLCHGNGGNISHRLEKIRVLNGLGLDVFIFDYRGYGNSGGRPSEEGLYLDAEVAYDYLVNERGVPYQRILGYGESLGGAVIVDLALRRDMAALIVEDSFTSARDMGREVFPFIPAFLYKSRFDSLSKIKNVRIPKLILHSRDDEIVPFEQGRRLFEAAPGPKEFLELRGGHNDAFVVSIDDYVSGIGSFLKRLDL